MAKKEGRSTVYNNITSPEKLAQVNPENVQLEKDFLDYLFSIDRAKSTIFQYRNNLHVFWCWNLEFNQNKPFPKCVKRDFSRFQNHTMQVWGWSPKRIRTVRATLSSLSNFIETILDDEYEGYKPIVRKIEAPANVSVRKKTVFEADELQALLDYLVEREEYMKACMLSLAMNSGRRKAELPRFKVSYFNDENLICEGALYKTPEKVTTKGRGSRGKELDIYVLAKPFKPYLDLWLKQRKQLKIKSQWLFPLYKGGKWHDEQMNKASLDSWSNSFSRLLGKTFYWHSLRHYLTTALHQSNIPDTVIQSMIGWESTDMVNLYNDTPVEHEFDKYFGAEGIKKVKSSSLTEL